MDFLDYFVPDAVRDDPDARWRARTLIAGAFSLASVVMIGLGVRLALGTVNQGSGAELHPAVPVIAFLSSVAIGSAPWLLRGTGSIVTAGTVLLAGLYLLIVGASWFSSGLGGAVPMVAPLLPMVAAYLLGPRAGVMAVLLLLPPLALFALPPQFGLVFSESPLTGHQVLVARGVVIALTAAAAALFAVLSERERIAAESERKALLAELEAKNAELGHFTYAVSHDLRSPLTTIRGYSGLLVEDVAAGKTDRLEHYGATVNRAAAKMGQMIENLLALCRLGTQELSRCEISMEQAAREATELLAGRIAQAGTELEIASDLPIVAADPTLVHTILQNLLDNAIKFSAGRPDPRVTIGARDEGGETIITVRDNGAGIAPEHQETVFELFHTLDGARSGSGVGLASVQRAVQRHGGRAWVESEGEGRGSTFCFTLPDERPAA